MVNSMRKEIDDTYFKNKSEQRTYILGKTGNETTMDISKMGGGSKKQTNPEMETGDFLIHGFAGNLPDLVLIRILDGPLNNALIKSLGHF